MSKTNVYVLIATGLLGILLVVVQRISGRADVEPVTIPVRSDAQALATASADASAGLPRLDGPDALVELLERRGFDAGKLIADSIAWHRALGFNGPLPLLGKTDVSSRQADLDRLDDDSLRVLSRRDTSALQALAARLAPTDPFAALELYEQAAERGSVYALLQNASLRQTLGDVAAAKAGADPEFNRRIAALSDASTGGSLRESAFAAAMAAIRDAGIPVIDAEMLRWTQSMARDLPTDRLEPACAAAEDNYLRYGALRRQQGLAPLRVAPPAVFVSLPDVAGQIPCADTSHPLQFTLNLSTCGSELVADAAGRLMTLYVCPPD